MIQFAMFCARPFFPGVLQCFAILNSVSGIRRAGWRFHAFYIVSWFQIWFVTLRSWYNLGPVVDIPNVCSRFACFTSTPSIRRDRTEIPHGTCSHVFLASEVSEC